MAREISQFRIELGHANEENPKHEEDGSDNFSEERSVNFLVRFAWTCWYKKFSWGFDYEGHIVCQKEDNVLFFERVGPNLSVSIDDRSENRDALSRYEGA